MGYLDMALKAREQMEVQYNIHDLIDRTLQEINQGYQSGTLAYMKRFRPGEWRRMVELEGEINKLALKGDVEGLKKGLMRYQGLILGMMKMDRPMSSWRGERGDNLKMRIGVS